MYVKNDTLFVGSFILYQDQYSVAEPRYIFLKVFSKRFLLMPRFSMPILRNGNYVLAFRDETRVRRHSCMGFFKNMQKKYNISKKSSTNFFSNSNTIDRQQQQFDSIAYVDFCGDTDQTCYDTELSSLKHIQYTLLFSLKVNWSTLPNIAQDDILKLDIQFGGGYCNSLLLCYTLTSFGTEGIYAATACQMLLPSTVYFRTVVIIPFILMFAVILKSNNRVYVASCQYRSLSYQSINNTPGITHNLGFTCILIIQSDNFGGKLLKTGFFSNPI
ncbi:hypothetical protein EDC94DRAFT_585977 [Helicostylum pulchrum]|nr:hypothetical protein EDC94DRAFT_585977 [Helicostylum pulchrum]